MAEYVVFSVDLEPNKDGTLTGVRSAMEWFDKVVPRGTVFATYRIATEDPDLLAELASAYEVGVHVHPREFGYEHDQLAKLRPARQRQLISKTRSVIAQATGEDPISFRAGSHSATLETIDVLRGLGFRVDASMNARYDEYLPGNLLDHSEPFELDGLTEVPVTHGTIPRLSRCGLRALAERPITATASTLRTDRWGCPGLRVLIQLAHRTDTFSFYLHPYDATDYHELPGSGVEFRRRFESLVDRVDETKRMVDIID